ncbi:DUF6286 domain-containing protein [Streptomyces griseoloalbus]|uniref:DUF6286 domain-containing protein n=1 Tax=Streptomyces griseoloalbus TaxID=67303 RepID=A0A7W8BRU7_9ACTN|nr:DUF6286 domain-containing protein [Streptomyces albaduncus]MBB5126943.1 hypothetical protein [Streptomyces albaduncus]GGV79070.1 hypothetical protein GCM10010294_49250 [Streptomyces griseoloalbus]GGW72985.1 hypothetical protein GCM10010340_59220 [Streptomyces albaduncus]
MSEPQGTGATSAPGTVMEQSPPPVEQGAAGGTGGHRRFWSARRVPAALLALVILVIAGAFLYDIAAVRADRNAMQWRRELARQLAERPLDDTWVLTGAGLATALGLWLLLLALTPGLRSLLPMRRTHPDVRAGLHRDAAAMVLRDRAMEVAGVRTVRVRVTRSRADVRAVSHFRELDDVQADLDAVLDDAVRGLGLARPPTLSLRVRRPGRKGR